MKYFISTSSAILLISLAICGQELAYIKSWYKNDNWYPENSQNLYFDVRGTYSHPVKHGRLYDIKTLSDISSTYPKNWITSYISTEITATHDGKTRNAIGKNEILTAEQKDILVNAEIGTDVVIDVKYNYMNPATDVLERNNIHYSVSVIPETEAEFPGGSLQLRKYIMVNAMDKISESVVKKIERGEVTFTVDENGDVINVKISKSSGDNKTDKLFIDAIYNMPKWKPAKDSRCLKVKQGFIFSVSKGGC